jgi:uncharacterized membrane protein HdeD (DUF308 family)
MPQSWTERLGPADVRDPGAIRAWIIGLGLSDDDLRRVRTALAITGSLSILAGLVAIAVPAIASVTIAVFLGWVLVFASGVSLYHAWTVREREPIGLRLLDAGLGLIVGIWIIVSPLTGTLTLTFLLAVWFFGRGALLIAAAWQARGEPGVGFAALNGALSAILGIFLLADFPSSGAWAIGLLVGINLILWGARALVAAWVLKQAIDEP